LVDIVGAPDPAGAQSVPEFITLLNLLRSWAGDPSYRDLARDVSRLLGPKGQVSHSTVADVFKPRRRRLDLDLVVAIVRALGLDEDQVARWREACVAAHAAAKSGSPLGVMRQLPADLPTFTGRGEILDRLLTAVGEGSGTIVISAIEGMAGIGKTQLAIHAGHALARAGRCPDAQLYVNLHGFDPDRAPTDPAHVLDDFLRQLGVPAAQIPVGLDARAAMFRDRMHGSRALLVLDNAANEKQVADLLPASPTCTVLITSRRSLAALDGAQSYQLDVLSESDAIELLARIAGPERVSGEPEAARAVARFCGHLPLALTLAAGRLRSRAAWTVADLLDHLEAGQLDSLATGGRAIRPVFELSYRWLGDAEQRVFQMMALHPGPAMSVHAVAALADVSAAAARRALTRLQDEYLVEERSPQRYEFHDLVRAFAKDKAAQDASDAERRDAFTRMATWYLHSACAARSAMDPHLPPMNPTASTSAVPPMTFDGRPEALAWFEQERVNLVAVCDSAIEQGMLDVAWQLPTAMFAFFDTRMYYRDWVRTHRSAAEAAARLGDKDAQGRVVCNLGSAFREQQLFDAAIDAYQDALTLFEAAGWRQGQAKVLGNLASTYQEQGRTDASIETHHQAIALFRELRDDYGQALSLTNLGNALASAGRNEEAAGSHQRAIDLFEVLHDERGRALATSGLGAVEATLGNLDSAVDLLAWSIATYESLGDLHSMARVQVTLADTHAARGDEVAARRYLELAVAVYRAENDMQRVQEITARLDRMSS
jgi:tetratricopeptide (TPR) repeat protein